MKESVKIYGKNSSKYNYFKYHLKQQLEKSGLDISIVEVNDLEEIVAANLEAIPAIKIGDQDHLVCHPNENLNSFLKEVMSKILEEYEYGNMKRILVPIDFSESSIEAFKYAKRIAGDTNAAITLTHYYHPSLEVITAKSVEENLQKIVNESAHIKGTIENEVYISLEAQYGFAADLIIDSSSKYDLVVMATSRGGDAQQKWFGSVSSKVSKNANCPVLLIPPKNKRNHIRNIFYPLENRIQNLNKIQWLIDDLEPTLHFVHYDQVEQQHSPMIKENLGQYADILNSDNPSKVIYQNDKSTQVDESITDYIDDKEIDLLVLEKGEQHFLEFFIRRSMTEKILNHINIPVIVFNNQNGIESSNGVAHTSETKI